MNWPAFLNDVKQTFDQVAVEVEGGRVLRAAEPMDLIEALKRAAEDESEREAPEWFGTVDVLEERFPVRSLFSCEWIGSGPTSWGAWMYEARVAPLGSLVLWFDETGPRQAIALIQPAESAAAWPSFFQDLFSSNGASYGFELVGNLPDTLTSHCPDLVAPEAVKAGLGGWLEWCHTRNPRAWENTRDWILACQAGGVGTHWNLREVRKAWAYPPPEDRDYVPKTALSEADRRLVVDNLFDLAYEERPSQLEGPFPGGRHAHR